MELTMESSQRKEFPNSDVVRKKDLEDFDDSSSELDFKELKSKEIQKADVVCKKELEGCGTVSSGELDVGSKKEEERRAELELEMQKKNVEYEALEMKFRALEVEKLEVEDKLKGTNRACDELREKLACIEGKKGMGNYVDLTEEDEDDKVLQLMIENKVLECEKKKAETEVENWKEKFKVLECEKQRAERAVEVWREKFKVLECEKQRAERAVEVWREKFKKLESRVMELDGILVTRSEGNSSDGRINLGLELPKVHFEEVNGIKEVTEVTNHKDGFQVEINLEHVQTKNNAVELDVSSTSHSPGKRIGDAQAAGTPYCDTPNNFRASIKDEEQDIHLEPIIKNGRRVRRQLAFEEERSLRGKIAPATSGCPIPPHGIIDIRDSDDECHFTLVPTPDPINEGILKTSHSTDGGEKEIIAENKVIDRHDVEDMDICEENLHFTSTPKRKRATNIVTSDSESDDDDDKVPICRLKRMHHDEVITERKCYDLKSCPVSATVSGNENVKGTIIPPRRRLVTLRQFEGQGPLKQKPSSKLKNSETKDHIEIPKDDESEEGGLESEGESLGGFIVHSSDVSESDDDSAPAATVCRGNTVTGTVTPPRHGLMASRHRRGQGSGKQNRETKDHVDIPAATDVVEDRESEEVRPESEGESLSGFIVDSSNDSASDTATSVSPDESDDNMDFGEILSTLRRNKKHKKEWEFEADMLAAFGKDPELCMKAVCALYRQQTSHEKMSKETLHYNSRGFSKFDATRGSELAEFITDGDPKGDVKKSVGELLAYDPKAVEVCRTLATHYSKQLFEIYKNKEDPLFLSS